MANSDFTLPDVGEGLTEAEIVSWKVKAGDTVTLNQVLVEIETAKSLVELPSPFEGTVAALLVEQGQTVEVGTPIITVSSSGDAPAPAAPPPRPSTMRTPAARPHRAALLRHVTRLRRTAPRNCGSVHSARRSRAGNRRSPRPTARCQVLGRR
ncbi:MAG TPA: biotin/lipoyl-binding protein, partial [Rhodoglobus sp.]|nr:biotin/lipoyl-binding protein [Rhodoglobus sp.]